MSEQLRESPQKPNTLVFHVDFTQIEDADNGDTTYYGGSWTFNGEERDGYGNDRSDNPGWDMEGEITEASIARWPQIEGNFNLEQDLDNALFNVMQAIFPGNAGVVTVSFDETTTSVLVTCVDEQGNDLLGGM